MTKPLFLKKTFYLTLASTLLMLTKLEASALLELSTSHQQPPPIPTRSFGRIRVCPEVLDRTFNSRDSARDKKQRANCGIETLISGQREADLKQRLDTEERQEKQCQEARQTREQGGAHAFPPPYYGHSSYREARNPEDPPTYDQAMFAHAPLPSYDGHSSDIEDRNPGYPPTYEQAMELTSLNKPLTSEVSPESIKAHRQGSEKLIKTMKQKEETGSQAIPKAGRAVRSVKAKVMHAVRSVKAKVGSSIREHRQMPGGGAPPPYTIDDPYPNQGLLKTKNSFLRG